MKRLKKRMLVITFALLFLAMMVAPVVAIPTARGPMKALGKNPRLEIGYLGIAQKIDLVAPSGVINRWVSAAGNIVIKPADEFNCPNFIEVGNNWMLMFPQFAPENENKWIHMSKIGYEALFEAFGLDPPQNVPVAGVYIKYNAVPQPWI